MKVQQSLIIQAKSGDQSAFRELVSQFHRYLISIAYPIVGDRAEEIVQEAWVTIYQKRDQFDEKGHFKAWIGRIVSNRCIDCWRKHKHEVLMEDPHESAALSHRFAEDGHWQTPPSQWHSEAPEALLEETELLDCLSKKVTLLPEQQKQVFTMKEMGSLTLTEISETLKMTQANVRVLLHRARVKLYEGIERFQESGIC